MHGYRAATKRDDRTLMVFAFGVGASIVLHGSLLGYAAGHSRPVVTVNSPIEVAMAFISTPPPSKPQPERAEPSEIRPKPKAIVRAHASKPATPPSPVNEEPLSQPMQPVPIMGRVALSSNRPGGAGTPQVDNPTEATATGHGLTAQDAASDAMAPGTADEGPVVATEVKVPYPEEARRAGIEGMVRLRVTVAPDGRVVHAALISGPSDALNQAALSAIERFTFKPATRNGVAVGITFVYAYTFELN